MFYRKVCFLRPSRWLAKQPPIPSSYFWVECVYLHQLHFKRFSRLVDDVCLLKKWPAREFCSIHHSVGCCKLHVTLRRPKSEPVQPGRPVYKPSSSRLILWPNIQPKWSVGYWIQLHRILWHPVAFGDIRYIAKQHILSNIIRFSSRLLFCAINGLANSSC